MVVAVTHFGTVMLDGPQQEQWGFYILRGVEGAVLFGLLALELKDKPWGRLALFACILGAFQEAETAVCGAFLYGYNESTPDGLCIAKFGIWPYALAGATIAVFLMRKRRE